MTDSPRMQFGSGRVAVLELTGALSPQERAVLTDQIRGTVVQTLPDGVAVMSRENMEVMLSDMGIDSECVSEGACEVETARNLGVDYVVSGSITPFGDLLVLSIKLHEVNGGSLLAQRTAEATSAIELLKERLPEATKQLLSK